jgi:hypothetical protein
MPRGSNAGHISFIVATFAMKEENREIGFTP